MHELTNGPDWSDDPKAFSVFSQRLWNMKKLSVSAAEAQKLGQEVVDRFRELSFDKGLFLNWEPALAAVWGPEKATAHDAWKIRSEATEKILAEEKGLVTPKKEEKTRTIRTKPRQCLEQ